MEGDIDLGKSISFIFDDNEWVTKIGILFLVNLAFGVLAVILIGFVFLAAQFGWTVEMLRNMQAGDETPMPGWSNFAEKITLGASPLGAGIVYSLIPGILSCVLFLPAMLASGVNENAGGVLGAGVTCLLVPLMIVYAIAAGLFFTLGTMGYSRSENIGEYFKFASMWDTVQRNGSLTVRFIVFSVIVNVGISALGSTGIGGIVGAAFGPPILTHLLGQYSVALDGGKAKSKPKAV